ncbi:DNA (cytosine-5-)-methyltransferase [Actinomyces sp. 2119]|uniref:DNA (cytosine-5-)-methyltransferase n=1 Tax=Actinomyces sp. 2119 TaxID=2321393 RepID=UPI0011C47F98|nr:DNA (cytosine-5-)-methyltransferase [Actinomyces sp. 2119]
MPQPFTYVDLFAGIGGFHAALSAMGGRCAYAVEIDPQAALVYQRNWGLDPLGDITEDTGDQGASQEVSSAVPSHDLLAAGFPCQPFSKSGAQRGMEEVRGTLFFNIMQVVRAHHPAVLLLENVRNLAGPRHRHEWEVIIRMLREEGYRVSATPAVLSPHQIPPRLGGRPQVRERVFITATYDPHRDPTADDLIEPIATPRTVFPTPFPEPFPDPTSHPAPPDVASGTRLGATTSAASQETGAGTFSPSRWRIEDILLEEGDPRLAGTALSAEEAQWIDAWDAWVQEYRHRHPGTRLPGFPIWVDAWVTSEELEARIDAGEHDATPRWKMTFLRKNADLYTANEQWCRQWLRDLGVQQFPPTRRKLEWQAQDTGCLWDCLVHLRPSGLRAKAPTYVPALVAITQTSIVGPRRRRLAPRETARLQGLPDAFSFGDQPQAVTYRQLGNAVNVGAAWNALRLHCQRDREVLLGTDAGRRVLAAVEAAPPSPDDAVASLLGAPAAA